MNNILKYIALFLGSSYAISCDSKNEEASYVQVTCKFHTAQEYVDNNLTSSSSINESALMKIYVTDSIRMDNELYRELQNELYKSGNKYLQLADTVVYLYTLDTVNNQVIKKQKVGRLP